MINRKLQTQPLDPNVVTQWESENRPLSSAPATQPLKSLGEILGDKYAQNRPPQSEIPSASQSVSSALSGSGDISAKDAELLLDVSAKLGQAYRQDKAVFQETMSALTEVVQGGKVDFRNITPRQQELLYKLGLTPNATATVYQQLYQMLLPQLSGSTSSAFESVQAKVSSFISNVDLKESTMQQIASQAQDLSRVQGVVSTLSAGSISALLQDQTASVYDLDVSRITSQNFDIKTGMDFTLGHFMVLSQNDPNTLQQVENILKKVKTESRVSPAENQLLNKLGLNINVQNKIETIDNKVLSFDELNHLESVAYSMMDPTEGYSKVLQSSAAIVAQNAKFQAMNQQLNGMVVKHEERTKFVAQQDVKVQQTQAAANQLDVKLQQAQVKAYQIKQVASMAASGQDLSILSPQQLGQMNIQVVKAPTAFAPTKVFVNGQEVSHGQLLRHLDDLVKKEEKTITETTVDLAEAKDDVVQQNQVLVTETDKLEQEKDEIAAFQKQVEVEKLKLEELVLVRDNTVNQFWDMMSPEEQRMVKEQVVPAADRLVQDSMAEYEKVAKKAEQALQESQLVIASSRNTQKSVQEDVQKWEGTLKKSEDLLKELGEAQAQLEAAQKSQKPEGSSDASAQNANIKVENPRLYQSPEKPLLLEDEMLDAPQTDRKANAKAAEMLEAQLLDREQREKQLEEEKERMAQNKKRVETEQEIFKTEQAQIQDSD